MIKSGYPFYGQKVGILVFDQKTARLPGDPGHNSTFDFPVCYEVVEGRFLDLINGSDKIKEKLTAAVSRLRDKGILSIVGDCGLMALYQTEMAVEAGGPVFTSALLMIPLVWQLIGRRRKIGVLTGHAGYLSEAHLRASGWSEEIALEVQGMECEPHFSDAVINGITSPNRDDMKRDVLNAMDKLMMKGEVSAVIVECSNLATYSADIAEGYGIPVFDVVCGARLMHDCVDPRRW